MSCPKDTNLQVRDEFGNLIAPIVKRISKCKGRKSIYPSFNPVINSISVNTSIVGVYTVVYITGSNFLPPCNGDTYVNFGPYTNIPITFFSSFNISFVVPLNAPIGLYNIRIVNIYNDNFSLPVSQSNPGIPNYSNAVSYKIVNIFYTVSGNYTISSDSNYNTIINFLGNGNFTILNNINNIPINYIAVGGGGGGAGGVSSLGSGGGGGGGGGVATGTFGLQNSYPILIGNGGLGGNIGGGNGNSGGSTQITSIINVPGGSFGRSFSSSPSSKGGNSGNGGLGGTGNAGNGGNGSNGGGGGGGSYTVPSGFNGGNGAVSTLSVYSFGTAFGAGGGGGGGASVIGTSFSGTGGNIYAGNGGNGTSGTVGNGTANYGGGGGGGISGSSGVPGSFTEGGKGGSGRVVLYFNN